MVLRTKQGHVKKLTVSAVLLSIGLVLHYLESLIPAFSVLPGAKIGLANLVTLFAFSWYGSGYALLIGLLRSFLGGMFGSVTTIIYSAVGTILSIFMMALFKKVFQKNITIIGVSIVGAFFFNVGQIIVSALVVQNVYMFSYLPVLGVISAFSGLFTGILAKQTERVGGVVK